MRRRAVAVRIVSLLVLVSLVLSACAGMAAPTQEAAPAEPTVAEEAAPAQPSGPILTDKPAGPGERPVQQVVYNTPADYEEATGNKISGYSEAPALAELVQKGELPPVEERLPKEPVVVKPEETIGKYGGTLVLSLECGWILQHRAPDYLVACRRYHPQRG